MTNFQREISAKLYCILFIPEKYTLFAKRPVLPTLFICKVEGKKKKSRIKSRAICINKFFRCQRKLEELVF